jgi:type II restriction/modification system DNA methylase subunit YeeA
METAKLKKFAQFARRSLMEQVSAKLKQVLADNSPARRENTKAISQLENAVKEFGKEQVIERVAYTWFNRFCALRFMDVNRYTRIGIVSPAEGQFQPEILAEAKMGHIDENMVNDKIRHQVFALLDGKSPSHDPQGEAYRLLLVAACNSWHRAMSFLFEEINDYTELLMPDDLLSGNSILAHTREAMTPDVCEGVEVIGWLYQFYISEKKDAVFAGLKKNKKITPENIPAATQLFTPHWIVRYLVENSLGRLWMLNRPHSRLIEKMDYYIKPEQPETDFLHINKPEEIKFCDPACGSGHILAYAFDLFYAMYEEEGYEPAEIPGKILTHNLYGIEIDERAGALAAFALTMKARTRHRRFFRKPVTPNICVLKNVQFDDKEINEYMDYIGRDLFTSPLQTTLRQFEEADNFGSLIRPDVTDVAGLMKILESKNIEEHMFLSQPHRKVLQVLHQADYLSPKYHVVATNPPYMGGKGMNGRLGVWARDNYMSSKSDLFAMFIERNLDLALEHGSVAMITMQSWMFLSSFESFRGKILGQNTIISMAHLGARAFDSIGGEVVSTTAFVLENSNRLDYKGAYLRLVTGNSETEKNDSILEAIKNPNCGWFYRTSAADFKKIPGSPFDYWLGANLIEIFNKDNLAEKYSIGSGLSTSNNERFVRFLWEVNRNDIAYNVKSCEECKFKSEKWFFFQKGGEFRKWYGNLLHVVNWRNDGEEIKQWVTNNPKDPDTIHWSRRIFNIELYFRRGLIWSTISSGLISFRLSDHGSMISNAAGGIFGFETETELFMVAGALNSKVWTTIIGVLNPTVNYSAGIIQKAPLPEFNWDKDNQNVFKIAIADWDAFEIARDFNSLPLLNSNYRQPSLKATYLKLRAHWQEMTFEMQRLEEENNRIFIEAYGLQDELTPDVPLKEITLTCNPHYRYGGNKNDEELEAMLLADSMRELISYAVGCMFGRYSLDKEGLILANQGETIEDYLKQIPEPSFTPDEDNVIPLLDADWFSDDITERFKQFLRTTFGEEHYEDNLTFIEQALNIKGKRSYTLRDYFLGEFYSDHVRRYKKRPIYWLFSSPKGSFNALIYMHRYQPYTASTVLSYLRDFKNEKLRAHKHQLEAVSISASASKSEKARALKEIEKVNKIITELEAYERDILYPLATKQVEIDLDDGVKVNYPKFGTALKKIPGLTPKEA